MLRTLTLAHSWVKSSRTKYFITECWKSAVIYWILCWKCCLGAEQLSGWRLFTLWVTWLTGTGTVPAQPRQRVSHSMSLAWEKIKLQTLMCCFYCMHVITSENEVSHPKSEEILSRRLSVFRKQDQPERRHTARDRLVEPRRSAPAALAGVSLPDRVLDAPHPEIESKSSSAVSDSLQPHGLYSPWNSPGQNTGVGSRSLLQGTFPTQGLNPGLLHSRWIVYQLSHQGRPFPTLTMENNV